MCIWHKIKWFNFRLKTIFSNDKVSYKLSEVTVSAKDKEPGWQFTKLLRKILKIFCNFKVLLQSSYS